MPIDRAWIQAHIPHQGGMCLLHAVQHWDGEQILCIAHSHAALDNPLRGASGLRSSAGIEYAAQAMAVHGALLATQDQAPEVGFLTSVRNVQWSSPYLHVAGDTLHIHASRISGNDSSLLYDFRILSEDRVLLHGRAGVLTRPAPRSS